MWLGGGGAGGGGEWTVPVARQLAVGIAAGEGDVGFFNLESGACLRLLRCLPAAVAPADAWRAPFLTRIPTLGSELTGGARRAYS